MNELINSIFTWVQANPEWALLITFIISLAESLAVIGTIVPGTITMTAIGILSGTGVMRIDLTLIAASLGAIAGDVLSYIIGYVFRSHIPKIWPFTRYPYWLRYGQEYFKKHGIKSVFFGRFIGPLRAIIPVIAGMMHMKYLHFLLANIASAIGWSVAYIMPGVIIGAASAELSEGSSKKLILIIFGLIILFWLLSKILKIIYFKTRVYFKILIQRIWQYYRQNSLFLAAIKKLAPNNEIKHIKTLTLVIVFILLLIGLLFSLIFLYRNPNIFKFNTTFYLFVQTLRFSLLDNIFIILSFFTSTLCAVILYASVAIYLILTRYYKLLLFWSLLSIFCVIAPVLLNLTLPQAKLPNINFSVDQLIPISVTSGLIIFLINALKFNTKSYITGIFNLTLLTLLLASIAGHIYLGNIGLIKAMLAYLGAAILALIFWIFYRRDYAIQNPGKKELMIVISISLLLAMLISNILLFTQNKRLHSFHPDKSITLNAWWNNKVPVSYTSDLSGNQKEYINIQYYGSLQTFKNLLQKTGWREESKSVFLKLFIYAIGEKSRYHTPIFSRFYQNNKPAITMIHQNSDTIILHLWPADFLIQDGNKEFWFGVIYNKNKKNLEDPKIYLQKIEQQFNNKLVKDQNKEILLLKE